MKYSLKTKLRLRFVLFSALALFLLLSAVVSASIFFNYRELTETSDLILTQLKDNPTLSVRYFSVKLHPAKGAVKPEVVQNVSVTPEKAGKMARSALDSGEDQGWLESYRYLTLRNGGEIRILFLSRSSSIELCIAAAENLIAISLASLAIAVCILIPLSAKVVSPLVENHRKQKEFITAAGHQLKTPLTVIGTDAQLLSMEIGENEWVDSILRQVDRMTAMTREIVALSKAEELSEKQKKAPFSPSEAALETAEYYKSLVEKKGMRFSLDVSKLPSFDGNEEDFCRILTLLLDNAFKYSPDESEILLELKKEGRYLRLVIENQTAVSEDLAGLTDRFYRGKNAHGTDGFGLGLAVVKSLAERDGGKLSLSRPEKDRFRAEVLLH